MGCAAGRVFGRLSVRGWPARAVQGTATLARLACALGSAVEHRLHTAGVPGSNPGARTTHTGTSKKPACDGGRAASHVPPHGVRRCTTQSRPHVGTRDRAAAGPTAPLVHGEQLQYHGGVVNNATAMSAVPRFRRPSRGHFRLRPRGNEEPRWLRTALPVCDHRAR